MGTTPFDLDALEVESDTAEPFHFTWGGQAFTMPLLTQMEWQEQTAFIRTDDPVDSVRLLLGDQFDAFTAAGRLTVARLNALLGAWQEFQGVGLGESGASASS